MESVIKDGYSFNTFQTPILAAERLAELVLSRTEQAIQKNSRCVWAISGGNSILKIYDALLAREDRFIELSEHLIVLWVDERHVPHSHPDSNFGNAYSYFWNKFEKVRLIPVPYQSNLEESASAYNKKLDELYIGNKEIDITFLGMGGDGHTASLFPNSKALFEEENEITTANANDLNLSHNRISMSYSLLNSSKSIFLYFYGPEKNQVLKKAIQSKDISRYPILGIKKENLQIYHSREK